MITRNDSDYDDFIFAIRAVESGEAKSIRKRAGMSQYEVSRRLNVSQVSVFRWEDGTTPRIDVGIAYGRLLKELITHIQSMDKITQQA